MYQLVKLYGPKFFTRAKFMIQDVYKTTQWDDACITEIEFWYQGKKLEIDLSGYMEEMELLPRP